MDKPTDRHQTITIGDKSTSNIIENIKAQLTKTAEQGMSWPDDCDWHDWFDHSDAG